MRNSYRVLDSGIVVIDVFLNDEYYECLVSESKLSKLLALDVKWRAQKSTSNSAQTYYVVANVKQDHGWGRLYMHRFLTDAPTGKVVDHENHNGLDNRDSNIETVSYVENAQNIQTLHPRNKSGHRGVYWNKREQRWMVQIVVNGKKHYGGRFKEENLNQALLIAQRLQEENYTTMSITKKQAEKEMKAPIDKGSTSKD